MLRKAGMLTYRKPWRQHRVSQHALLCKARSDSHQTRQNMLRFNGSVNLRPGKLAKLRKGAYTLPEPVDWPSLLLRRRPWWILFGLQRPLDRWRTGEEGGGAVRRAGLPRLGDDVCRCFRLRNRACRLSSRCNDEYLFIGRLNIDVRSKSEHPIFGYIFAALNHREPRQTRRERFTPGSNPRHVDLHNPISFLSFLAARALLCSNLGKRKNLFIR